MESSLGTVVVTLVAAAGLSAAAPRKASEWQRWESGRATISEIVIHIQPVFDLSKPSEDNWLGRTANHLHIPSREYVLRRALLFKEGDRVLARTIYETERLLRAMAFVKDARILPEAGEGGVRVHVWVRDAWTIEVDASIQQVGGQRSMNFGVQDQNFLGSGKTIGLAFAKDHERTNSQILFRDPQVFGTRWTFTGDYHVLSDGDSRAFTLGRPFFALNTPWSTAFSGETRKSRITIYDRTQAVYEAPYWSNQVRMAAAWRVKLEDDRAWRAGIAFTVDDRRYGTLTVVDPLTAVPAPSLAGRRQRGPALTLAYQQDAYESFLNIKGMDTPEDYNLAWEGSLEVGSYTRGFGSTRPGPYLQLHLARAWSQAPERLTLFDSTLRTRSGGVDGESLRLDASVATYLQVTPTNQLAAYAGAGVAHRPDPENYYYMGGTEGLRGYRNTLHPGDANWVLSLEDRFFTEQRWWGIFRVGYVAFVDVGAVHRTGGDGWSPAFPDVGLGLRLGDLKSSLAKVLLLSVAFPLTRQPGQAGWQFSVGNSVRF